MKSYIRGNRRLHTRWTWRTATAILLLVLPLQVHAALGAQVDSVQEDQLHLQDRVSISTSGAFTIYELITPFRTVVREYVSSEGRVFAISWQGPFMPDLKQLLAGHFEQYSMAAKEQRDRDVERTSLEIRQPSLVVQNAGHMRAYAGRAYDPTLLPPGVSIDEIR